MVIAAHYRRLLILAVIEVTVAVAFLLPPGARRSSAHLRACAACAALDFGVAAAALALNHRPSRGAPFLGAISALKTAQGLLLAATAAAALPPHSSSLRWARGALPLAVLRVAGVSVTSPTQAFFPDCLRALADAAVTLLVHHRACGVAPALVAVVALRAVASVVFSAVLQRLCWQGGALDVR